MSPDSKHPPRAQTEANDFASAFAAPSRPARLRIAHVFEPEFIGTKNQIARRNLEIEGVKELGRVNGEKSSVERNAWESC